ncbi:hypothetical protein ACWEEL_41135, partial [Streptomyces sp. NPDC005009]
MSETSGAGLPGTPTTLFQHALRLHRLTPDEPLFRSGEPFPGAGWRRRKRGQPFDPSRGDADAAKVLDAYFLDTRISPRQLATELLDVPVSSRYNEHIGA